MKNIKPELKRLHSPDVFDLNQHNIREGEPYSVLVQAMFGPKGLDGEESFDFLVCNILWINKQLETGILSGKHLLIVNRFNIDAIEVMLDRIASEITGRDWNEVATKLGRYGKWEFEDYNQG